jgi:hypothetical protein
MDLHIICLETDLNWKRVAIDMATVVWSLGAVYFIKDDICASGAGSALAGMDGVVLLIVFSLPSFLVARRRGISFLKITVIGKPRSGSDVLPAATVIVCVVGLMLNTAVIIDQAHYLCFSR